MEKRHTLTDVKQTTKRKNRCCFFGRSWKENKKELKCYSQFTLVQITAAASANTLCARERAAVWGEAMSQWNAPNKQAFCHQFRTVPVQLCVSIFHTHIYMYRFELRSIGFTYVSVVPFWMLACSSWHWRACYKHNFSLSLSLSIVLFGNRFIKRTERRKKRVLCARILCNTQRIILRSQQHVRRIVATAKTKQPA